MLLSVNFKKISHNDFLDMQALLVTQDFHPQPSPLSDEDLETWAWCLGQTSSVGFYNSDLLAGASQKHKHMQLVPLESIAKLRHPSALHVCDILLPYMYVTFFCLICM